MFPHLRGGLFPNRLPVWNRERKRFELPVRLADGSGRFQAHFAECSLVPGHVLDRARSISLPGEISGVWRTFDTSGAWKRKYFSYEDAFFLCQTSSNSCELFACHMKALKVLSLPAAAEQAAAGQPPAQSGQDGGQRPP